MSNEDSELEAPELTADDLLVVADPYFTHETVALVTGAASGIGEATAMALAANGLTTVGLDIDEEGLGGTESLAEDLGTAGEFVPVPADLTDEDAVERAVDETAEHGDLRFVANIAGLQHIDSIPEFPLADYDRLQDIMLRGPFLVAKHAISHIEATDDGVGAIGNMSSVHGHYATQDKPAYITAKHGLHGLTKSIAAEGEGVLRGFSVSVGYVLTPLMVGQIEDTARERGIDEQAVIEDVMLGQARTKRMMTPAEVANLFVFGFSRHATHLNGGDLLFDAGYTQTYE